MDYNILNLIKPNIDFAQPDAVNGEKSPNLSLLIRFNIPINPHILDNDSAFIVDKNGTVLSSTVKYDKSNNAIKLIIKNEWREASYYFLNIGGNIKSLSGHFLSGNVKYRFRIRDGKPSDFLLISGKTSLGADRVNSNVKRADVQIIEKLPIKKKKDSSKLSANLPYIINFYMITMFFISCVSFSVLYIYGGNLFLYLAVLSFLLFFISLLTNLISRKGKSKIEYNLGAFCYNVAKYEKSIYHFEKSLYYDKRNIKSRLALDSAFSLYLNKML